MAEIDNNSIEHELRGVVTEGSGDEPAQLVARRRRSGRRTGSQPVLTDDQLSPIEGRTVRLSVQYRAAIIESSTAGDLETDPARMA